MIDLRGALVGGPDRQGCYYLRRAGYAHQDYLELLPGVRKWRNTLRLPANLIPREIDSTIAREYRRHLREYQIDGVNFILSRHSGALIGLGTGLGKSRMCCAAIKGLSPTLIVGPLNSMSVWCGGDDPKLFDLNVVPIRGEAVNTAEDLRQLHRVETSEIDAVFLNPALLDDWAIHLNSIDWKALVVDEAHDVLRNPRTHAAKILKRLSWQRSVVRRLALTATPIVNGVSDLWSQLDFVEPHGWGPWVTHDNDRIGFRVRYCGATQTEYGWKDAEEETHADELKQRLKQTLFFVPKSILAGELPPLTRQAITLPKEVLNHNALTQYEKARDDIRAVIRQRIAEKRANGTITTSEEAAAAFKGIPLQQSTGMAKYLSEAKRTAAANEALSLLQDFDKVVVFCWYKETAAAICKALRKDKITVDGPVHSGVNTKRRGELLTQFAKNEGKRVFVATLGTCATAMNELRAASAALFVDLYYVPALLLQAEGRIHRSGQLASHCYVRYLLAAGSIDEFMFKHLQRKARAIAKVGDDPSAASLCETLGGENATKKQDHEAFLKALMTEEWE